MPCLHSAFAVSVRPAISDNQMHTRSCLQLNLAGNKLGPDGAKALAPALVRGSLTSVRYGPLNHERLSPCLPNLLYVQVNIDGFALPIKQLKGIEPVDSLNFSNKELGPASAIVIASLIRDNAELTKIR